MAILSANTSPKLQEERKAAENAKAILGTLTPSSACTDRPGADMDRILFDHLLGAQQGRFRNSEAERLGGLEVNGKLEQGWLLDWQLSRLLTTQNSGNVLCGTTPERGIVRAVADETAIACHARPFAHGRQASL